MVECPLHDLDMSNYVPYPEFIKDQEHLYDLYAVINHYGILQAGHYTCVVKNEELQTWLNYDDSSIDSVPETSVISKHAYILFYKWKDVSKIDLTSIIPSFNEKFIGKPIRTKYGTGYYLGMKGEHTIVSMGRAIKMYLGPNYVY